MANGGQPFNPVLWHKMREGWRDQTRQTLKALSDAESRLIAAGQLTAPAIAAVESVAAESVDALLIAEKDIVSRFAQIKVNIQQIEAAQKAELARLAEEQRLRAEQEAKEKDRKQKMRLLLIAVVLILIVAVWIFAASR